MVTLRHGATGNNHVDFFGKFYPVLLQSIDLVLQPRILIKVISEGKIARFSALGPAKSSDWPKSHRAVALLAMHLRRAPCLRKFTPLKNQG
jgi:hypothetical protein